MKLLFILFSLVFMANSSLAQKGVFDHVENNGDTVWRYVEIMPEPLFDLNSYITSVFKYPDDAREHGISGRVVVGFRLNENGDVDSVWVKEPVYPSIDSTATGIISRMPKWKPGMSNGKPVRVFYTLALKFDLGEPRRKKKKR